MSPADSPGFLLWHVTLSWQRAIAAALAPLQLTHAQFVLLASLWWLSEQGGAAPNQLALAGQAGMDVKTTSQVLGRLEAKKLLTRTVDPGDTRAKQLHITAIGRRLAIHAIEAVEGADEQFFAPLGDSAKLLRVLRPLAGGAR
ncbi:MAG: MarR family transcriptional regulator [Actinomycetota bacterium]|nr:MarR family transcriptional regulator [Actinomycetota bacterium]